MRAKILIFFINTTSALQKTWACFMKNISIFFYFLYKSRQPLYDFFLKDNDSYPNRQASSIKNVRTSLFEGVRTL